jgi:hypothetical protein
MARSERETLALAVVGRGLFAAAPGRGGVSTRRLFSVPLDLRG